MKMTPETLAALKDSIQHWHRLYTGTTHPGEDTGDNSCALCGLFYNRECNGCPISKHTNNTYCVGSPYVSSSKFNDGKNDPEFKKQAKKMYDFLVSLFPSIVGKQYGRRSEAFRAIRNHCKKTGENPESYFTNQLDGGDCECHEVVHETTKNY